MKPYFPLTDEETIRLLRSSARVVDMSELVPNLATSALRSLHCTARAILHYITLHYTALHCTVTNYYVTSAVQ